MKKILYTIFFFCLVTTLIAQSKSQRRIYLWDVTLSMKGYGGSPNIYDDVVKFLVQEIESITDESTEIIVLPFQVSILEEWKVKATIEGKKDIIRKIKNYSNSQRTNTNIVVPVKYIQAHMTSPDRRNLLFLLTDGKQTEGNGEVLKMIESWDTYAKINDMYGIYVMLTQDAVDTTVIEALTETDHFVPILPTDKIDFLDIQPAGLVKMNIKEDKTVQIPLSCKKSIPFPADMRIKVTVEENPYIVVKAGVTEDRKVMLNVEYKIPYDSLKTQLSEITRLPLHIEVENKEEIQKKTGLIVLLHPNHSELELINKPEKTLKISIKR